MTREAGMLDRSNNTDQDDHGSEKKVDKEHFSNISFAPIGMLDKAKRVEERTVEHFVIDCKALYRVRWYLYRAADDTLKHAGHIFRMFSSINGSNNDVISATNPAYCKTRNLERRINGYQ